MKTIKGIFFSIVGVCIGVSLFGATVAARREMPASGGRVVRDSDTACFTMNTGAMRNTCTTRRYFDLPLVVDHGAGHRSASVDMQDNDWSTDCQLVMLSAGGVYGGVWMGERVLSVVGGGQIVLNSVYMPSAGGAYVSCRIGADSEISMVHWDA